MLDCKSAPSSPLYTWSLQGDTMLSCSSGVPLSDRGFRYGQHLFETVATRGGRYLFAKEHCERLAKAAERFGFPFSKNTEEALHHFLKTKSLGDGMLRMILTAGDGAPAAPVMAPRLFAFWEKTIFPSQQEIEQGVALVSLDQPIGTAQWGEKTGNYWEHLRALKAARMAGAMEGLVFDFTGHVISAAMANLIVWFADGSVVTPPRARGARDGVVLAWVHEQIPNVIERDMTRRDLSEAVAMAITNSRLGVMPVAALDGVALPHFSLSLKLACDYLDEKILEEKNIW